MTKYQNRFLLIALVLAMFQGCSGCVQEPCDPSIQTLRPGVCPDPNIPAGEAGGECVERILGYGCDSSDLMCISNTCLPCGGDDEVCCGYQRCSGGAVCDEGPTDEYPTCNDTCTSVGSACCANNQCGPGLTCNANSKKCEASSATSCGEGANVYEVRVRKKDTHCGGFYTIRADTLEQAKACLQPRLDYDYAEFVSGDAPLQWYTVCNRLGIPPWSTVQVQAYSQAEALTCARSLCTNCTPEPGACN